MDEPTVFGHVISELDRQGHDCLVHYPSAHKDDYADKLEGFQRHQITIAGRYPDIIGFTTSEAVFTVEVKGESDFMKGIGQAMTYRRGSHLTYIAAPQTILENDIEHLSGNGIGALAVTDDGEINRHTPRGTSIPTELTDIEGRLSYQLRESSVPGSVSTIALSQPINFFAPPLAVHNHQIGSRDELDEIIESEYGFDASSHALDGARTLNLLKPELLELTDQAELALTSLRGIGVSKLSELAKMKNEIGRKETVAQKEPVLATLLRMLYRRHPDFQLFLEAIATLEPRFTLQSLLEHLVKRYPNVYLNLVCRQRSRNKARKLIESGSRKQLYTNRKTWEEVLYSNFIANFVQQLKHIGVLSPDTRSHNGALGDYDPDEKPWILTEEFISS